MDAATDRRLVVEALAEPAHRLLKEALGRLVAAEAMLEAMTGGLESSDEEATNGSPLAVKPQKYSKSWSPPMSGQ